MKPSALARAKRPPAKFLDVSDCGTGCLQIVPVTFLMILLTFFGVWLLCTSPINRRWSSLRADHAASYVSDYAATFPGDSTTHGSFFPPDDISLYVSILSTSPPPAAVLSSVNLTRGSFSVDASGGYTTRTLSASASLQFPRWFSLPTPGGNLSLVDLRLMNGQTVERLPLWRHSFGKGALYDGTISVSRITRVSLVVYRTVSGSWGILEAAPGFTETWNGQITDLGTSFPAIGTSAVEVHVSDAAAPLKFDRSVQKVDSTWRSTRSWIGMLTMLAALILIVVHVPMLFGVYRNVRRNNGLPPSWIELLLFTPTARTARPAGRQRREQGSVKESKPLQDKRVATIGRQERTFSLSNGTVAPFSKGAPRS